MVNIEDLFLLLHPVLAVIVVYPIIGIVVTRAWQVRQRRLQVKSGNKSQIPPVVGKEHVELGRYLTGSVVGLCLIALGHDLSTHFMKEQTWSKEPFRAVFVLLIFLATIASFTILYKAREKLWRGVFATLTGMGLILLGAQKEIYRRDSEWYLSHYYYGIVAALLMLFSLAIIQDIYMDRTNRWRKVHIILNSLALLFFIAQAFTGTRDLYTWYKP